jgi:hypothetical protein
VAGHVICATNGGNHMTMEMKQDERRALVAALARRLRRLAKAACRGGPARAGPEPQDRPMPDAPARGIR